MAYIFDSLGYAKRLRDGGVPRDQAEAHAEAARDFIMVELATKADLLPIQADLHELQAEFRSSITELRGSIVEGDGKLRSSISELERKLDVSVVELRNSTDTLGLRLTVRLGAMIVVAIGALAAILKLA